MAPVAKDFEKIIHDARERRKNEALADKIFSKDRRQSAPTKLKPAVGGSLASRVGIKKQRASRASLPSGNVNGEWTHDLHDAVAGRGLGSRITQPGAKKAAQRKSRLATALDRMDTDPQPNQQVKIVKAAPATRSTGMTIKGLAGPYSVMAQNFAPGTSTADIESAMTPIGGEMITCNFVKTSPFIVVEMVFASKEGAERVIETFNDKTADGRVIKVWAKIDGYQPSSGPKRNNNDGINNNPPPNAPSGPRTSRPNKRSTNDLIVDGSMGFSDSMDTDVANAPSSTRPLYSDKIVARNRRGRGGFRGRGGG